MNLRFQAWLAQSVERTTLTIFDVLTNAVGCCDRVVAGSIPASGARSSVHGCVGTLLFMSQSVPRKNARQTRVRVPARETNKYTATYAVPRSLGGQDSRFSLSQLCVAHTPCTHTHLFRKEASTLGFTHSGFDSQLATYRLCSYGLVGHNVRLTRGRSRVRTPV